MVSRSLPLLVVAACGGGDLLSAEGGAGRPSDSGQADSGLPRHDTDADADADSDTDADTDTDTDTGTVDPCAALAPLATAADNHAAITACLALGRATLGAGTFDVNNTVVVPPGATLDGSGRAATLRAQMPSVNSLVTVQDGATVTGMVLDANQALSDSNGAVVHVTGSGATVSDCWVGNANGHATGVALAGVYFISDTGSGSVVKDSEITGLFYGVIFRDGLDASEVNTVQSSTIHDLACDGVTFAGYGEMVGNTVYRVGSDCENGPIPGATVYGLYNTVGARIDSNTLYDTCGNVVDLDTVSNFEITGNEIRDPGYTWDGAAPWCSGQALMMIDSSSNIVTGNVIVSNDRVNNRVDYYGDIHGVYRKSSSYAAYSDLGGGADSVIAFALLQRPSEPGTATGNIIDANEPRAACGSGCTGVGYYSSRGTGLDSAGVASESTMNYYSRNNPYGSNIGSSRCGFNWYAWDDTCDGTFPSGQCNGDDHQHTGFLRQDGCEDY